MVRVGGRGRGAKYRHLLEDRTMERWYRNVARGSQITADVYLRRLGNLCAGHKITPAGLVSMGVDERRDFLADLVSEMEDAGRAGTYIMSSLRALKSWLAFNGLAVQHRIKVRDAYATPTLEKERVPAPEELRSIFLAASPRDRCAAVLMAHAGLRPEALGNYRGDDGLRLKDLPELKIKGAHVSFDTVPTMVVVRAPLSKAGHRYFTFLGKEGVDYLKAYLEERLRRGEKLGPESDIIAPVWHNKSFLTSINASDAIRKAMRAAGFRWRPYVLRAYFDTQLLLAESKGKIARDYRAFFMGHKGDIEARYTTHKGRLPQDLVNDMRDAYRRSMPFLETVRAGAEEADLRIAFRRQMLLVAGLGEAEISKLDLEAMTDGELQGIVRERLLAARMANGNGHANGWRQKVVPLAEVEAYIEKGWEWVAQLPDSRVVLKASGVPG